MKVAVSRMPGSLGIAIVGAGPAGLVLSHLLQREGIPFVVFERQERADLCRLPKAGLIEYRTVALLEREGISPSILDFSVENHRCEFRTPGESVVLEYAALTGGRPHYIYPQHLLVQRLCEALIQAGGEIRFGQAVRAVQHSSGRVALSVDGRDGDRSEIECEVAAGCDGSTSAVAAAMSQARVFEQSLPLRLLVILGAAPPLEQHTIYAAHPRGFAGQMRRGPDQTRYFLEVPGTDTVAGWPEQRARAELSARLGAGGRLGDVPLGDFGLLDMRVRQIEPMQQGPLFLAGDAAHLITPAGGKGMNLAIQDAVELGHGLIERFGPKQDGTRLSAYSQTRLPHIWRTQAFSNWHLHLIFTSLRDGPEPPAAVPGGFANGLRQGWITTLQNDPVFARWFAHAYAGVDPD
jgi:p-hydroxybenzoate 3-monooxygenase